jgi:1-acyl-sn-glycerol-3-phosphate acyltransferase
VRATSQVARTDLRSPPGTAGYARTVLYGAVKAVVAPVLRRSFTLEVEGLEHVPPSGAVILASNHQAFCDSLFIPAVVPRQVTFVAKAEYFEQRRTAWFFRAVGQIPMYRGGGEKSERSLDEALNLLKSGGALGIYPEGTRSPDERLHRGRTGVARLALAAGCAVVPVGVTGTREVQPIGARMMRPFKRVGVKFGEPLDFTGRYSDRLDDPMVLRQITDELMFEIRELTGQEYVDKYASRSTAPPPPASPALPFPAAAALANGAAGGPVQVREPVGAGGARAS